MAKRNMTRRMLIMLACVLLLIALLALGKFLQIRQLIASVPKPGPQTVTAMTVPMLEWRPQLAAVGTLNPVRGTDLSTEVAGLVRSVTFKSGHDAKAGELLVQLNADADVAQLQALQVAVAQAEIVLTRDRRQLAVQAISQAQIDAAANDLKAKRAQVDQQAATVAKKSIRAPFAGRLGITHLNPGQYVNPGDKLVTLQTLDPIHVDFTLPQQQLGGLAIGQVVEVGVDTFGDRIYSGKINAINPIVDPSTRNVQVEATLANPKHELLPGMFANVKIDTGEVQHWPTVPLTAITYNPYGSTVFLVLPGPAPSEPANGAASSTASATPIASAASAASAAPSSAAVQASAASAAQLHVQQVFVRTGATRGDQVAVVKGLQAGQRIVTSGQIKLKNGTPVVIDNRVQPSDNPNPKPQEE